MTDIHIKGDAIIIPKSLGITVLSFWGNFEGWRRAQKDGTIIMEFTPANKASIEELFPNDTIIDDTKIADKFDIGLEASPWGVGEGLENRVLGAGKDDERDGRPDLWLHQRAAVEKFADLPAFALFMDMGTGKTRVLIEIAAKHYRENRIDGVFVVTFKTVHEQWIEEQLPEHFPKSIEWTGHAWNKKLPVWDKAKGMKWFTMNIDAIRTPKGYEAAMKFMKSGRMMMVIDESHLIKSASAKRSKIAVALGKLAPYRAILTGTPIAKNLIDEWAQFKFLDESILEHRYMTSFRREYCIMGGYDHREVIGYRSLDKFKAKVAPYAIRIDKSQIIDIPKLYEEYPFKMSDEQRAHVRNYKELCLTMIDSGEISSTTAAAAALARIQQITCGYLQMDNGDIEVFDKNPRLDALMDVISLNEGKIAIWCRFRKDIELIKERLGDKARTFYGGTSDKDRTAAKEAFLEAGSGVDYLILNPAAGGVGLNLQGECRTNVYYSNSFNAIDRWQSEDRTHRIGTTGAVSYIDLVCKGSIDASILRNLEKKQTISNMALSDIKVILDEL